MKMSDTTKTFDKIMLLGTGIVAAITWSVFLFTQELFVGIYSTFILVIFGIIWLTCYIKFISKAILDKIKGDD